MAGNKKDATSWKFKLVAVLLSTAAIAGLFGVSFSVGGDSELKAGVVAAIPVIAGVVVALLLGKINKLSDNKWQIYVAALLIAAVLMLLRINRFI